MGAETNSTDPAASRVVVRAGRREIGAVYTPAELAEFVLDIALTDRPELLDGRILEPACGPGVFLLALMRRIARRLIEDGDDLSTSAGHAKFVGASIERLFGNDVDPSAVRQARQALAKEARRLSPGPLPDNFMASNVTVQDFLDPIMLTGEAPPGLIVGNPPYVPTDRLPQDVLSRLRQQFTTATGRIDLYTVFMQQASDIVALGGRWTFITPDKYLTSESAATLREYLGAAGSVSALCRFQSHSVFDGAATVPCVTVWDRAPERGNVRLLMCDVEGGSRQVSVGTRDMLPRGSATGRTWSLRRGRDRALTKRLTALHPTVADVTTRVSAGPATGLNRAFLLPPGEGDDVEPELLHGTVGGRDIAAHKIADARTRMLLPYDWDPAGAPRLIDLDRYPGARAWLGNHRAALEQRHCVRVWGHDWWDLHDPLRDALQTRPKVLVPDLARTNRFAADPGRVVPQHSVYYLLPTAGTDPLVLAALLNSAAVEFLVRTSAPIAKDGFRRYRRQFLVRLPVPEVAKRDAEAIRSLAERGPSDALTELVDGCFGVDPAEIRAALAATYGANE